MVTPQVRTWDILQDHPIAKDLDNDARLALLCEYFDLYEELQGKSLVEFVDSYFADNAAVEPEPEVKPEVKPKARTRAKAATKPEPEVEARADILDRAEVDADEVGEPSDYGDGAYSEFKAKPASMVGLRVVYRFPGRNVLSDANRVTRDSGGTVAFTDVDGESWSNVARERVYPIDPDNYREIHVMRREAEEIEGWLAGNPANDQPEGALLRSMAVEFTDFPEKITFAIMNGKRPYVDRFVALPNNGFEDDQKPTTRFFGEHCFRIHGMDYIVNVVSP